MTAAIRGSQEVSLVEAMIAAIRNPDLMPVTIPNNFSLERTRALWVFSFLQAEAKDCG